MSTHMRGFQSFLSLLTKYRLNPVMLVFIGKLSLSTVRWVPICEGFSHFSACWPNIVLTLSCWFSLESSHWVLSDEYPFAMVSVISQLFVILLTKLATSSERVKGSLTCMPHKGIHVHMCRYIFMWTQVCVCLLSITHRISCADWLIKCHFPFCFFLYFVPVPCWFNPRDLAPL